MTACPGPESRPINEGSRIFHKHGEVGAFSVLVKLRDRLFEALVLVTHGTDTAHARYRLSQAAADPSQGQVEVPPPAQLQQPALGQKLKNSYSECPLESPCHVSHRAACHVSRVLYCHTAYSHTVSSPHGPTYRPPGSRRGPGEKTVHNIQQPQSVTLPVF